MTLRLNGSTSGYTEIDAPAVAGSNTLVLPTGNGSSGQVLTTNGSGALSWSGMGPAFRAYPSAATTLSASAATKVLFQTEEFDTANCFASSRFTPNVAGYYLLSSTIRADIVGQAALHLYFYKNGTSYAAGSYMGITANSASTHCTTLTYMNGTTDYIESFAYSSAAGSTFADSVQTWFSGFLARPA
jgi:hypothetical protein